MPLLLRFWREFLILILTGMLGLGYAFWPKPEIVEIVKEKTVEKIVTKTVVKTVTQRPDGTIITEDKEISQDSQTKTDKKEVIGGKPPSKYSVLLLFPIRAPTRPEVGVGAQLGSLPIEVLGAYDFESKAVKVGLGVRF